MIHWEVAHQPGVRIILIGGENFANNRYIKHVPLGGRPHSLQKRSEKVYLKMSMQLQKPQMISKTTSQCNSERCFTLCVWWMMTALSESVSTTWKLSIVAVKDKVNVFACITKTAFSYYWHQLLSTKTIKKNSNWNKAEIK